MTNFNNNTVTPLSFSAGTVYNGTPIKVGSGPQGIAFDGANMWVANTGSNSVTKFRVSDEAVLGTYPVGVNPCSIAYDGANIWVTNQLNDSVTRIPTQ